MKKDELKLRVKEKIKKKYPRSKITESPAGDLVVEHKEGKGVMYLEKMLREINVSPPSKWEGIMEQRVKNVGKFIHTAKIIRYVPREYLKSSFRGVKGKLVTRKELEKGGIIILKETPNTFIFLTGETEDSFISIAKPVLKKKYKMSDKDIERITEKAKKKLEKMGL